MCPVAGPQPPPPDPDDPDWPPEEPEDKDWPPKPPQDSWGWGFQLLPYAVDYDKLREGLVDLSPEEQYAAALRYMRSRI